MNKRTFITGGVVLMSLLFVLMGVERCVERFIEFPMPFLSHGASIPYSTCMHFLGPFCVATIFAGLPFFLVGAGTFALRVPITNRLMKWIKDET